MAYIYNNKSNTLLSGTSYGDEIYNVVGNKVSIYSYSGNDSIESYNGESVTIDAADGNDYIDNYCGYKVKIDAGAGNDTIRSSGYNVTITGGFGNDYIENYAADGFGSNIVFKYNIGDGNDTIVTFINKSKLLISGGSYSTTKSGNDIIVTAGDGQILLKNVYASATKVRINDETISLADTKILKLSEGNDSIINYRSKVTIEGGTGNDYIDNASDFDSVNSDKVSINGGASNDEIHNSEGDYVTLEGGAGDDFIHNWFGSNVTISGGTGNDSIITGRWSKNNLVRYTEGDGNDTIYEFDGDDTLSISGDSYSTTKSGSNVIVNVGDGSIFLVGAASLSAVNIDFKKSSVKTNSWTLDGTTAKYGNLVTIKGVKSLDGISLSGTTVTIAKASLGTSKVTISDGYTLKLADDVSKSTTKQSWNLSGTKATCNQTTTVGYTLIDNAISYTKKATKILLTVSGVKSIDGLKINGKVVTVSNASLNAKKVTISDGYTLALGSDVAKSYAKKADWDFAKSTATYKQTTSAGYSLASDGKSISYSKSSSKELFSVSGVKSEDGLSLSGKVVTVSKASLNSKDVKITGNGYTLALAKDVTKSTTKKADWDFAKSTATYKQTTTAGYTLADDAKSISYSKSSSKELFSVSGVKSEDGLSLSGKVVTVSKASLNSKDVEITGNGYTLALAKDVTKPSTKKADWSLNKSTATATYKDSYNTAGYKLASDSKSISYTKATTAKTLATINGAKSTSGLSVNDNVITLKNSALNKKVTVSGDYEFDFASDYSNAVITGSKNADTIIARGKNITIKGGAGNDVLTGSNNADVFVYKEGDGNDIITNYDEADKISIESGTVEVTNNGKDVIFNGKITVTGGASKTVTYIENGVEKVYPNVDDKKSDAVVLFNDDGNSATLTAKYEDDKFTPSEYSNHKNTLVSIDASAVTNPLTIIGNKKGNVIFGSAEDDYIDGDLGGDKIKGGDGNDTLVGGAGNDSLNGGKGDDSLWGGAGTDTLFGGDGSDIFVYKKGDGKVIIADYDELDTIRVLSGNVGNPASKNGDVTFKIDDGQIVVKGGSNKYIPIYYGSTGENIPIKYSPGK